MRLKLVTLRYAPSLGGFDDRPLSDFVRDKEVLAVREHFFSVHDLPHVACLITYQDPTVAANGSERLEKASGRRSRGDLSELLAGLSSGDQVLFGTLREWRAARAKKDGVPPYVLFTNRELLSIVRAKPRTPSALQALEGVGAGKVERYGKSILEKVNGSQTECEGASPNTTPTAGAETSS